ncbi:MAG: FAD:protein FMN transferase [Planctomycetaceae bacterium]|nr:FAD:protein FMN transferase [Planctomycetaceae bacterium]
MSQEIYSSRLGTPEAEHGSPATQGGCARPKAAANTGCGMPSRHRYVFFDMPMTVPVEITLEAENEVVAKEAADAAFRRFHELNDIMSDYDPESEVVRIAHQAGQTGKPVKISDDLFRVLDKSKEMATVSEGAFDVTVAPLVKLWRRAGRLKSFPEAILLEQARRLVGNDLWSIDENDRTVTIKKNGVRFDLGGIAKGDAIDQAIQILKKAGIPAAVVNAGGDLRMYGQPACPSREEKNANSNAGFKQNGQRWVIGVSVQGKEEFRVTACDVAVASSGDLERHVILDGKQYSHIIDPHTGIALTDRGAVTVIAPDAITADALASALSVLPPEKGLALLDRYPETSALIARIAPGHDESTDATTGMKEAGTEDLASSGRLKTWTSKNWLQYVEAVEKDETKTNGPSHQSSDK